MWYKNIRFQNLLIFTLSAIGILGSVYLFKVSLEIHPDERILMESAVFSELVGYITRHPESDAEVIFLGRAGSDPPPAIMERFENRTPAVMPASSAEVTFGFTAPVVDRTERTRRGIQVNLDAPKKESGGLVTVRATLYQNRLISATYTYTLVKRAGAYHVLSLHRSEPLFQ
ncbi:MAG: hypothetical protein ACNA78_02900 [Balneolaceae bacterium]